MADDVDAIFEPASWLIKIDFINQFILNNNVLISILGEAGVGKTTFARLLQDKLDPNVRTAIISATSLFEPSLFLSQLCSMLDIESKLSIADIATEMCERKSRALIIVDNAEQLPEAFIKELLNALKQQEGSEFFHVCLLSDFSLVKVTSRLARELYQDMIHSIELQPFNKDETKIYVTARMASNDELQVELTDEWIQEFYQLTEGNITSMNTHMMSFFSKKSVHPGLLYKRFLPYGIISALVLATAGIGYYLFSSSSSAIEPFSTLAQENIDSIQIELPLSSDIPNYQVASIHQPMEMVSLQKAELLLKNDDASGGSLDESSVEIDKVVPIPNVMVHPTPKKNIQKIAKASVIKVKSVVKVAKTNKPVPPALHSGRYTLQLMASREKSVLTRLAKKYPASAHVKVRDFTHDGVHWYVLTQGEYTQKPLALHALSTLPKSLSQFKPWVRSTGNLREVG